MSLTITTDRAAVKRSMTVTRLDDGGVRFAISDDPIEVGLELGPADVAALAAYLEP